MHKGLIYMQSQRFQYEPSNVPTFMDTNEMPYDMSVPGPQPWFSRKMTF